MAHCSSLVRPVSCDLWRKHGTVLQNLVLAAQGQRAELSVYIAELSEANSAMLPMSAGAKDGVKHNRICSTLDQQQLSGKKATKKEEQPMIKLTIRYARYVLSTLATVGFGINLN